MQRASTRAGLRRRCPSCKHLRGFREPPGDQGGEVHVHRLPWHRRADGVLVCGWCKARSDGALARDMDALLHAAYGHVEAGRPVAATDALVGQIDTWLGEGRFDRVIALLERCDAERLAPDVLTGILSLTAHAKASLEPARPAFFERAMAALAAQGVPTPQREQAAARLR